jgi:hypothetical protein
VANTLANSDTATITAVKVFKVQDQEFKIVQFLVNLLSLFHSRPFDITGEKFLSFIKQSSLKTVKINLVLVNFTSQFYQNFSTNVQMINPS